MGPIELLNKHCKFITEYDIFVILAVSRKKDSPEITNSQEVVFREVIKNTNDIERKYRKIKSMTENYKDKEGKKLPFYIYVSLNRRDAKKAAFGLIHRILGWMEEEINGVDRSKMLKKIYGHFYSSLQQSESRSAGPKHFMIDYDEKNSNTLFDKCLKNLSIEVVLKQETRNGYHYKVKPFDRRLLQDENFEDKYNIKRPDFEVKTDALLFVEYINNEN